MADAFNLTLTLPRSVSDTSASFAMTPSPGIGTPTNYPNIAAPAQRAQQPPPRRTQPSAPVAQQPLRRLPPPGAPVARQPLRRPAPAPKLEPRPPTPRRGSGHSASPPEVSPGDERALLTAILLSRLKEKEHRRAPSTPRVRSKEAEALRRSLAVTEAREDRKAADLSDKLRRMLRALRQKEQSDSHLLLRKGKQDTLLLLKAMQKSLYSQHARAGRPSRAAHRDQ